MRNVVLVNSMGLPAVALPNGVQVIGRPHHVRTVRERRARRRRRERDPARLHPHGAAETAVPDGMGDAIVATPAELLEAVLG
jgi:hypothetical protein